MTRLTATADAMTVAAAHNRMPHGTRAAVAGHADTAAATAARARDLPREHRISHVFRTLGRGLVAEYDPA
jgi:hypothetical protein